MSGFLYHVPEQITRLDAELAKRYRLSHLVGTLGHFNYAAIAGGTLCADGRRTSLTEMRVDADPAVQRWRDVPGGNGARIGMPLDPRPRPHDLIRDQPRGGHTVEIGGDAWIIPVAREMREDGVGAIVYVDALPRRLTLGDDGQWGFGDHDALHARLWETACEWWNAMMIASRDEHGRAPFQLDDVIGRAIDAITVNYAAGPVEIDLLGIITDDTCELIFNALIDLPKISAIVKKKLNETERALREDSTDST